MSVPLGLFRGVGPSALLAATLAGCGATGSPPALTAHAASQMRAHLAGVRTSAAGGDARGATRALDAFAADVTQQKSAGHLSATEYAALETGIAHARQRIVVDVVAPSAPPAPTPVTRQPTAPPGKSKGHDKGEGQGND